MGDAIDLQVRQILYTNPKAELSPVDIDILNTLPIGAVREVIRRIYVTETNRDVIGKTYDAILALQQLDTVAFFIDVCDERTSGGRTTCYQTLGDFSDSRAIAKLCQVLVEDPDPTVRYFAIEAVTNFGDATVLPILAYARDHDAGVDYEGVPLADTAQWAIDKINLRIATQ